jgi:hypothetical protein
MGERERERDRKGWRGLLYLLTQKRVVTALRNSGKSGDSRKIPDTLAFQGQHPRKCPCERVGAKVSLIGFVMATRAHVRLLEDTFHVPLYSTTFVGLKFKI